jgi:polyferredoxin
MQDLTGWIRKRLPRRPGGLSRIELVALATLCIGFVVLLVWLGVKKQLFVEDSSLHWAAMLILICYFVLAGVIDDIPSRKLRIFSLGAIFFTAVSHMVVTSPVHFAFTARDDPASALTTLVVLVGGLFVLRSWCRYLCPWGHLMGFMHRFSRLRILLDRGRCNQCGVCDTSCDVAAIEKGVIRIDNCQFCHACVDHCANSALKVVDVWQLHGKQVAKPQAAKAPIPGERPVA